MNERVCSEALVMPSSTGLADCRLLAGLLDAGVQLVELDAVELLALDEVRLARVRDLDLLQHLPNDDLDVLVVDGHALQPVDVLDLVDQIVGELLDALDGQDVVRRGMAVVDEVATLDAIAVLHRQALAARDQVLDRLRVVIVRLDGDALLVLVVLAELDRAGDLGDDRVVLRTPGLEQLRHARQTAGDVARTSPTTIGIRASTSPAFTSAPGSTERIGIDGKQVAGIAAARDLDRLALAVLDHDRRLQVGCRAG